MELGPVLNLETRWTVFLAIEIIQLLELLKPEHPLKYCTLKVFAVHQGLQLVLKGEENQRKCSVLDEAECKLLLPLPAAGRTELAWMYPGQRWSSLWGFWVDLIQLQACGPRAAALPCLEQKGAPTPWVAFVFLRWLGWIDLGSDLPCCLIVLTSGSGAEEV
jgi:hypothetical protein